MSHFYTVPNFINRIINRNRLIAFDLDTYTLKLRSYGRKMKLVNVQIEPMSMIRVISIYRFLDITDTVSVFDNGADV